MDFSIQTGWRTIVAENSDRLSLEDDSLILEKDGTISAVPLQQIQRLMITSQHCSLTMPLLTALSRSDICVCFCDARHDPAAILMPLGRKVSSAGCILSQAKWSAERKADAWQIIIRNKIFNQTELLTFEGISYPDELDGWLDSVKPGDTENREGLVARAYFELLFGDTFVRHAADDVNAALNYGYTLILNTVTQCIVMHGLSSSLGIKHASRNNPYNLSCDIMEPFRPLIDRYVFEHRDNPFDWSYKQELIRLVQSAVTYSGKKVSLPDAVDQYVTDIIKYMEADGTIGEVSVL